MVLDALDLLQMFISEGPEALSSLRVILIVSKNGLAQQICAGSCFAG